MKSKGLKFIWPEANSFFDCLGPKEVKVITRLPLAWSHLRDHKFKYSFQDCLNPICSCDIEVEATDHYLLHCPNNLHERKIFLNNIKSVLPYILEKSDSIINNVLFFLDTSLDDSSNAILINSTIDYVTSTKRFDDTILTF